MIPHRETDWFTPEFYKGDNRDDRPEFHEAIPTEEWQKDVKFEGEVTSIEVKGRNLKMPWVAPDDPSSVDEVNRFNLIKGVMIESCGQTSDNVPDCLQEYQIVQDPRIASADRDYWTCLLYTSPSPRDRG